jgi:hypothetical protein
MTTERTWTWADLDDRAVALIEETERTLEAGYVVVYRETEDESDLPAELHLHAKALDESQLDCLRGVEQLVGGVAVAYEAEERSARR